MAGEEHPGAVFDVGADRPRLIVVNNGTSFLAEIEAALRGLGIAYDRVPGHRWLPPDALAAYTGAILTGGLEHVFQTQHPTAMVLNDQILDSLELPVLGICLGHQLVAHRYGATVEPLPEPAVGQRLVEIVRDDPIFAGLPRTLTLRVAHSDAVTGIVPPLVRLAKSAGGPFEAIRHETRPHYGVQFHPEASGEAGMAVLVNFARLTNGHLSPTSSSRPALSGF